MMNHISNRKCAGFSLVELLVGMVIGLFLVGGMLAVFTTSSTDRRVTEGLSRMQENGRFAIEFLTHDIRMAGFTSCYTARTANAVEIVTGADAYAYDFTTAVSGYEGGVDTFPAAVAALTGTDAIVIRRGDDSDDYFVDNNAPPTAASIQLVDNHDLKQGEILMIADCNNGQVGIFQMSNSNINNTVSVVDHNTGVGFPGNCTKKLWGSGDCSDPSVLSYEEYGPESRIMRMVSNSYYIANNASGVPSLYRKGLTSSGSISSAEELVEGVENMQIEYGVDSNADGVANQYKAANAVTPTQWKDHSVVAVRIKLLLRSIEESATKPQEYSYNGLIYDGSSNPLPSDRYLRREFSTTVKLRNVGL